jgi:hypothetical protein
MRERERKRKIERQDEERWAVLCILNTFWKMDGPVRFTPHTQINSYPGPFSLFPCQKFCKNIFFLDKNLVEKQQQKLYRKKL